MFGESGGYLDPLRACALSGESQIDVGISETATTAKYDAIIKQRRRTNSRTSVLNDVEKARLDLLIKRIDGERALTQTILNRQRKKVQNSLVAIEDEKNELQKFENGDQDKGRLAEIKTDRKSKRKRLRSPVSTRTLNVTRVDLKTKYNSKESEKESTTKMPILQPLKEEKRKEKQVQHISSDKHLTPIRFPAIGKVLYKTDIKPGVLTRGQSLQNSTDIRLPRAWSEPDSINSYTTCSYKRNRKCQKERRRKTSVSEFS